MVEGVEERERGRGRQEGVSKEEEEDEEGESNFPFFPLPLFLLSNLFFSSPLFLFFVSENLLTKFEYFPLFPFFVSVEVFSFFSMTDSNHGCWNKKKVVRKIKIKMRNNCKESINLVWKDIKKKEKKEKERCGLLSKTKNSKRERRNNMWQYR